MLRYPYTEWSLVLCDLDMAVTLVFFHSFENNPVQGICKKRYPKFKQALRQSFYNDAVDPIWIGHLVSSRFLITSSTSCSMKFRSIWVSGDPNSAVCALMFLCFPLSCVVESSGKNLWRRALAVPFSDVVVDPSWRFSDHGTGCFVKPVLQTSYNFQGVILVLSAQNVFRDSCLALKSSDLCRFLRALKLSWRSL